MQSTNKWVKVGQRMRELRIDAGLTTLSELREALKVKRYPVAAGTISKYERGELRTPKIYLEAFAKCLNPDDFTEVLKELLELAGYIELPQAQVILFQTSLQSSGNDWRPPHQHFCWIDRAML